ncbi:hypothetical protein [Aporhodopirellula aestuarii]|uniref:Transmembrane protein n=1 Tax=Aporhodopirellula aestuarii TaxID=2950107 RepID=A0ABT0U0V9_9BACT|nr:hypothetical protein [Aporhodopirellula aestuarii]MCM2370485.1 hypothetical protein [Aporhodopirellula aestuarii]
MTISNETASDGVVDESSSAVMIDMRTSRFERVSSFYLTLVLFLGVIVSGLFLLWTLNRWASQEEIKHSTPTRTAWVQGTDEGLNNEFDTPSQDEYQALQEPTLDATLVAVTDAATQTAATFEGAMGLGDSDSLGRGARLGGPDPSDENRVDVVPRFNRWQLNFTATDLKDYAAQLDFFGIELGVLGGGIQGVDIVDQLSTKPRNRRVVDTSNEKRLYFMWSTPSPLMELEATLIEQANVELTDRHMIQLIPARLEHELAEAELEFANMAGHESEGEIARTVFQCVATDDGYEFRIADQRYR